MEVIHKFDAGNGEIGVSYWCPGCEKAHWVPTPRWSWNSDMIKPTISPSVRHHIEGETLCHYHIVEGRIEYCGDSPHKFAGQKIPLELISQHADYGWPGT